MTQTAPSHAKRLVGIAPPPGEGSSLNISWMLHNLCNQHCSYCPSYNHDGSHSWPRYETAVKFLERVFAFYKKDLYRVWFTGGEPTLWPDLPRLCEFLKKFECELGVTSNGANTLEFWRKSSGYFNTISLSYHPEYARNSHFLDAVKIACEKSNVGVRLMMPPDKALWDRCVEFGEMLRSTQVAREVFVEHVPIQVELSRVSRWVPYEPRQSEFLAKHAFFRIGPSATDPSSAPAVKAWSMDAVYDDGSRSQLITSELLAEEKTNFYGWECRIGLDQLFIAQDGAVFRAGCGEGGRLGHLTDRNLAFPTKPIVCGKTSCPCGTDIMTPKWHRDWPPFRLRYLLNPLFVARKLKHLRSTGDLSGRAFNILRYIHGLFENRFHQAYGWIANLGGRWFPRELQGQRVANPPSPVDRNKPCRHKLSWKIHVACNYDCSYCWFHKRWDLYESGNRYLPASEWKHHWARFNEKHGPALIYITGGEPFTYPEFIEILEDLGRENVVMISTNLSWDVEPFLRRVNRDRVGILVSYHPDFVKDEDAFIEKILRLRKAGFSASISVVAYPPFLPHLREMAEFFSGRGIELAVQPFRGVWEGRPYPESYGTDAQSLLAEFPKGSEFSAAEGLGRSDDKTLDPASWV